MRLTRTVMLLACLAAAGQSPARDLGVQGNVWPIVERDMRQMLLESAMSTDWSGAQESLKESARTYVDRLPKRQLPTPEQTQTRWIDPSIVISSDIQAPVEQPDGDYQWQVIIPAGTKVNPLVTHRPVTAMLFFDGADPAQVDLVEQTLKAEPWRVVPVEAGAGNVRASFERFNRPVFHANDALVSRFQISQLPSILYPGTGEQRLLLGLTSFSPPFNVAQVLQAWPELVKEAQ